MASSDLNDYKRLGKLGEGEFGKVWKVENKKTGKLYALKVPKEAIDAGEMTVLSGIGTHENIVQFIDVPKGDKTCILMEYCDLGDLDGYLRGKKDTLRIVPPFLADMIDGLRFLHGKKIAHRDLKPANTLLKSTPSRPICKIADFGLSKFVNQESNNYYGYAGSYLKKKCGTKCYMAPEIFKIEEKYKKDCDIFSLGAISFVLFSMQRVSDVLVPHIDGSMLWEVTDPKIESAVAGLKVEPEGFREIIIKMLRKDYHVRAKIEEVYQMKSRLGL